MQCDRKHLAAGIAELTLISERQRRVPLSFYCENDQTQLASRHHAWRALRPIHLNIELSIVCAELKLSARARAQHPTVSNALYFKQRSVIAQRDVRVRNLAVSIDEDRDIEILPAGSNGRRRSYLDRQRSRWFLMNGSGFVIIVVVVIQYSVRLRA
jgi:hypothetical protein